MSLMASKVDSRLELSSDQLRLVKDLKQWVETEAEFYGRSEENFLILFLRSCDFDLELSKKTLRLYYQVRIKYPQWWANRDANQPQIQLLMKKRVALLLLDHPGNNCPTVAIFYVGHLGPDSSIMGPAGMFASCASEVIARRTNCQLYGGIFIFDLDNYYAWMMWKSLWPPFIKDLLNSFLNSMPIKIKKVVLINGPSIMYTVVGVIHSLLPEVHKNKIQCCKTWNDIGQYIPLEMLPVEYGGLAAPVKVHHISSNNELMALNNYILDDNKYGFLHTK